MIGPRNTTGRDPGAVVVMEPPENRDSRDAALELGGTRNRLLLRESLVRTRLVVGAHELGDEASEVVLAEEEDVVEQLPAQGAREPFGERLHVRCLGAIRTTRAPDDARTRVKRAPSFTSRSQTKTAGTA